MRCYRQRQCTRQPFPRRAAWCPCVVAPVAPGGGQWSDDV